MVNINNLPNDIIIHKIKPFISNKTKCYTNKKDYIAYKTEMYTSLTTKINTKYVNFIVKNDYNFIFDVLLNLKYQQWYKPWKIKYKHMTFNCFIDLLNYNCIDYKSQKCRKLLLERLEKNGIRKNKFKRIRIRKNKWTN